MLALWLRLSALFAALCNLAETSVRAAKMMPNTVFMAYRAVVLDSVVARSNLRRHTVLVLRAHGTAQSVERRFRPLPWDAYCRPAIPATWQWMEARLKHGGLARREFGGRLRAILRRCLASGSFSFWRGAGEHPATPTAPVRHKGAPFCKHSARLMERA